MWLFDLFKKKETVRESQTEAPMPIEAQGNTLISKGPTTSVSETNRFAKNVSPVIDSLNENRPQSPIKLEVDDIISTFETGNIPLLQNKLYQLCNKLNKPGSGKLVTSFPEKDRLCEVFNMCLQFDWMNDSDIREVWAENAFYCISEYFKSAATKQDYFVAALDLFLTCAFGKNDLLTKFNDVLSKAQFHPIHRHYFTQEEFSNGADYLVREFAFFSATIISPMVKQHPQIISKSLRSYYETSKTDFEFASIPPDSVMRKMQLLSAIIGSILDRM